MTHGRVESSGGDLKKNNTFEEQLRERRYDVKCFL